MDTVHTTNSMSESSLPGGPADNLAGRAIAEGGQLIENYNKYYRPSDNFSRLINQMLVEKLIAPNLAGDRFAELGVSTGIFSVCIAPLGRSMLLVDANPDYCRLVQGRLAEMGLSAEACCAFLEDLDMGLLRQVSDVFLISMIHGLPGYWPKLLADLRAQLKPGGRIHITTSNPLAPNRLIGFQMGLINSLAQPDKTGEVFNTQYVEPREVLETAETLGMRLVQKTGYLCRPVTIADLEEVIDRAGMELLWWMGSKLPDHLCNSTYYCLEV